MIRCSDAARLSGEPMAGSAPRADTWIAVEHPAGWGDAALTRSEHGVRVVLVRDRRDAHGPFRVWVGHATGVPSLRLGTVSDPAEVSTWDLGAVAAGSMLDWGAPDPEPLLLVCANGRRDRCCGHSGGRLADQLRAGPWRDRVLTSTHLGGHRFAPTALLLPWGALHGRLDAESATHLLAEATVGRTPASTLRGFSPLEPRAQVAEVAARLASGYAGLTPLPVELRAGPDPQRAVARVALPSGAPADVALARTRRETLLSCGRQPETDVRWSVESTSLG